MNRTKQRLIFFRDICELILWAETEHIYLLPISFYRTAEEQNRLFKEGRSKCDGYKKKSKHQYWLAIDFVVMDLKTEELIWKCDKKNSKDPYVKCGEFWEREGHKWGGNFKTIFDPYHFEF